MSAPVPAELALLRIFKEEALERMADDERVIGVLRERIGALEFHLGKLRDLLWLGYSNTAGVLPAAFDDEPKPARKANKK